MTTTVPRPDPAVATDGHRRPGPAHRARRERRRPPWRRSILLATVGLVAAAGLGLAGAALLARQQLHAGIRHAQDGLLAARSGRGEDAAVHLAAAQRAFDASARSLDAWWARPGRSIPVVGRQMRAVSEVSAVGAELAGSAAASVRASGVDDLQVVGGRVDLDLVRSMAAPLDAIGAALTRAEEQVAAIGRVGLLPPVADRFDALVRTLDRAQADVATAAETVSALPQMLGADGPRYYFVAFGTPAEARELGGFMGAYAVLVADDGRLSLGGQGRVRDLNRAFRGKQLADPSRFPPQYLAMQPQRYWQNITGTADFPTVAEAVRQLWPSRTLVPLDGVLYLDPVALGAMLELTGPVRVPGLSDPLTADMAPEFLLRDQYLEFPNDDRHDFLLEAATAVFERLTAGDLPGPGAIAKALGPSVAQGRLMVNSFVPREQRVVERLGLDGALPPVNGDFLSVRATNRGLNKVDAMLQRSLDYDVTVDQGSGAVSATLEVTLRNGAPPSGLPLSMIANRIGRPPGTSSTTVSLLTPFELTGLTQDGQPVGWATVEEYGRAKHSVLVDVAPESEVTLRFVLRGRLDLSNGYRLDLVAQPLTEPDDLAVRVRAAGRLVEEVRDQSFDAPMSVEIPIRAIR